MPQSSQKKKPAKKYGRTREIESRRDRFDRTEWAHYQILATSQHCGGGRRRLIRPLDGSSD